MEDKEAFYFSHDSNARHDPKILAMMLKYNIQGYGMYWVLIEMLRETKDYRLPCKKYIWNAFALQIYATPEQAEEFVKACINDFELLASDGEYFWSDSLLRRMSKKENISEIRRNSALSRWNNANAMQKDANARANAMQNSYKEKKEIKENKSIEDSWNEFKANWIQDGSAVDQNVYVAYSKILNEGYNPDVVNNGAYWYAKYIQKKNPDTYPHCEGHFSPVNFITRKIFERNWKAMHDNFKETKQEQKVLTIEDLYKKL